MSYENTECPCGDKKDRDAMLCSKCLAEFADHPSMKIFNSDQPAATRRFAAIVLLALSRKRNKLCQNSNTIVRVRMALK